MRLGCGWLFGNSGIGVRTVYALWFAGLFLAHWCHSQLRKDRQRQMAVQITLIFMRPYQTIKFGSDLYLKPHFASVVVCKWKRCRLPQSHMRFIRRGFPNTACSGIGCIYLYYFCKLAVLICLLCSPASTPPDQKSTYRGGVSFYSCVCFSRSQRVSLLKQGPLLITLDSYCVRVFVINWITVSLQSTNSVKDNPLFGTALSFNTHSEKKMGRSMKEKTCLPGSNRGHRE